MGQELQFSEEAGYYYPSFFTMHINTTEKIERIEALNAEDFSTLMHEYIHFIQDVTTIYGLGNIFNSVQYIKYATNQIYQTGDKFNVPIKLDNGKLEGSLINFSNNLHTLTYGNTQTYDGNLFRIDLENKFLNKHLNMKTLPIYKLNINVKNYGAYNKYRFGAGCIMESMAYILEKCLSGVDAKLPDYPYNSAQQVSDILYKGFAKNKFRLLALCDISLNSSNPAHTFVKYLKIWKKKKIKPSNARDLYDEVYSNSKFLLSQETSLGTRKQEVQYEKHFSDSVQLARESLHAYFGIKNTNERNEFTSAVELINLWIDEIMNSALKWRKQHPYFIIDIAEGGMKDRKAISEIYNEFGLPFCTNANNEGCFYHSKVNSPEIPLYFFMVAKQISMIFEGKTGKCCLYEFCTKCNEDNLGDVEPDIRCFTPWMRNDKKKMCPFQIVWNHWKLKDRRPFDGETLF